MTRKKFLRSGYWRYSKLGLRRKKKQIYRKAKGGSNKVRLNRAGRITKVKIGFGKERKLKGLVKGLKQVLIYSVEDIKKLQKNEIGIVAKLGDKKRLEIANYAIEHKIQLHNLNPKKFIHRKEEELKTKEKIKSERKKRRIEKNKK